MSAKARKEPHDRQNSAPDNSSVSAHLPFEPAQNRKKSTKKATTAAAPQATSKEKPQPQEEPKKQEEPRKQGSASPGKSSSRAGDIPEVVNRRMVRRVAWFSGIPTSFGMLTFVVSYFIVKHHWFPLPNIAVVLVSMGWFGLGVLGLSYGALSASWDEDRPGSWHGWGEFTSNFGKLTESWRSLKQQKDS